VKNTLGILVYPQSRFRPFHSCKISFSGVNLETGLDDYTPSLRLAFAVSLSMVTSIPVEEFFPWLYAKRISYSLHTIIIIIVIISINFLLLIY
jgi:hypothetical protein